MTAWKRRGLRSILLPSVSDKQRRLFGAALAMKRGQEKPFGQAGKIASKVSESSIRDFARKNAAKSKAK